MLEGKLFKTLIENFYWNPSKIESAVILQTCYVHVVHQNIAEFINV